MGAGQQENSDAPALAGIACRYANKALGAACCFKAFPLSI